MRTDSIKKYVIPNIPYLFIGWACLKLGTAYRLAPGVDLPHKLMCLGQTISAHCGPARSRLPLSPSPGGTSRTWPTWGTSPNWTAGPSRLSMC